MSTEQNKAIVRRFHELFDQGDLVGIEALLSPDFVTYQPGMPPLNSEGLKTVGMVFTTAFGDCQTIPGDVVAEGDVVFMRATFNGTHVGDFNGIPATGNRVQFNFMTMDRFVGGKIVEHWGLFDAQALMQQVGAAQQVG